MSTVQVIPAGSADVERVNYIFEKTIPDTFEKEGIAHLEEDLSGEIELKKKLLQRALQSDAADTLFLAAMQDDMVVGTISYSPCGEDIKVCTEHALDHVGELGSLYVLPSHQGQGIGSALIKALLTLLNEQGVEQFCLDSGYKLAQQKWLRKFGKPYVSVRDYWGPGSVHMVWLCQVNDFIDK
ncbi:GNAT family N-acetyltransferase [Paenibacillus shunpengii]|uniref:GNAT family N-acetyltransferase n=1 Tax=Paenibacillus shunpengii TaxID=2054424 RepID=A0ABW5SK46_9BACL|nr:GNAT family N-acetyltransferase [Paenibacillus sp. FSL H7-0326]OMC71748.1 GNAT family N-acetyltransferase [Paenibacillus sp. FSL H7-0326]